MESAEFERLVAIVSNAVDDLDLRGNETKDGVIRKSVAEFIALEAQGEQNPLEFLNERRTAFRRRKRPTFPTGMN